LKEFKSLDFSNSKSLNQFEIYFYSQHKTPFGPHGPRHLLQPPEDSVRAAKAPPPAGHGRCPAASPISLSSQILARTASLPLPLPSIEPTSQILTYPFIFEM
jgi:hypothetical protein